MGLILYLVDIAADEVVSNKTIIYVLAGVIGAMAAFIVKQFADRVADLKDFRKHSDSLENAVESRKGGNP